MQRDNAFALPSGHLLHEYRIERVLGAGGFGVTYLARDTHLNALVAIKEFLPQEFAVRVATHSVGPRTADDAESYAWGLDRFKQEARALARFKHPHIVRATRLIEANGTAYMVMDYEQGLTLKEFHKKLGRPLDEAELLGVFLPILDGLHELHSTGLIHRDIKPGNIYLRTRGGPMLIDFGAVRPAQASASQALTSLVTPGYAPLEQYSGEARQGPWSDLYAVGATLYACITGRAPTDAATRSAAQQESDADPLVPAVTAGAGRYSTPLLEAIDWALALRAKDRPQEALEFAARLGQSDVKPARIAPEVQPEVEVATQLAAPGVPVVPGAPTQIAATIALTPTEGGRPRPWWRTRAALGAGASLAVVALLALGVMLTRPAAPVAVPSSGLAATTPADAAATAPAAAGTQTAAPASVPATVAAVPNKGAPPPTRVAAPSSKAQPKPKPERTTPVSSEAPRPGTREPALKLAVGAVHRDTLPEGAPAPALVMLAGGTVRIGDAGGELADAQPLRTLRLAPFLLGEREVTRGEFRAFIDATGYRTVAEQDGSCRATDDGVTRPDKRASWKRAPYSQDDTHPVTCVSLADALAYTTWLSERTGRTYRLPTEAEWEYAARAGSATAYWWGTAADPGRANCLGCGKGAKERTVPADTFPANPWGLRDLNGNLREWTCSVYAPRYAGAEQRCAAPGTVGDRVVRGGSWAHGPERMQSAYRDVAAPTLAVDSLGFRVALDP